MAIDLPGHGTACGRRSSYKPEDLADYILEELPASVLHGPALVIAQSFSGIAATLMPTRNKNVVGVVMLDTPLTVRSTAVSVGILIRKFHEDREQYEWIPRLLTDFFHYSPNMPMAENHDYYSYIVDAAVPIAMITGDVKDFYAQCRKKETVHDGEGPESAEPIERIIVGTYEEVLNYCRKHGWAIVSTRAGACFSEVDLDELRRRNVNNLKVYFLKETGHNVLLDRNLDTIAELIGIMATERLAAQA